MKRIIKPYRRKGYKNMGKITYQRNFLEQFFLRFGYFKRGDEGDLQQYDDSKPGHITTKFFDMDSHSRIKRLVEREDSK